jgi:hypothetical protein
MSVPVELEHPEQISDRGSVDEPSERKPAEYHTCRATHF